MKIKTEDLDKLNTKFSLGKERGRSSNHFLRIKLPEGTLSSNEAKKISNLAEKYEKGYLEVTNTQTIQLHWIKSKDALEIFEELDKLNLTTDQCGQAHPEPKYGDVRNICTCPIAGYNKKEKINIKPIAEKLNNFFIGNENYNNLPSKFKISISGCEIDCARAQMWDLGFFPIEHKGEIGFGAVIGGSLGQSLPGPQIAEPLNVFIPPKKVLETTKALVEIHKDNSSRENKRKARFKYLLNQWGIEKIRNKIEEKLGEKLKRTEYEGPKESGEEHIGIGEQRNSRYYLNIPLIGGKLDSEKLRTISRLSEEYGTGELRTTPYQNLIILNIPKDQINELKRKLKESGIETDYPEPYWTAVGCSGEFCGKTISPHPKEAVGEILNHLKNQFSEEINDMDLKIRAAGCPNDCGLRNISNIGLLGHRTKDKQLYDLYIGGRLGKEAEFSELYKEELDIDEIKEEVSGLIKSAKEQGFSSFNEFIDDYSIEELKKLGD